MKVRKRPDTTLMKGTIFMVGIDVVVWDFDGVLNRNIIDGRFVWADNFETDLGQPFDAFQKAIFDGPFKEVIVGRIDLLDLIRKWADDIGFVGSSEDILTYWFAKDDLVDPMSLTLLQAAKQAGFRNVIATNNEARRAQYIESDMGFAARVESLFASGRLGVAKPDPAFFETVSGTLGVNPGKLFLVDDHQPNIIAARSLGWQAFHFEPGCHEDLAAVLDLKRFLSWA